MAKRFWVGNSTGHEGDWSWDDSGAAYATSNWIDDTGAKCAKPASADDVFLENSSQSVTSGFNQPAVTLASLSIAQSFTGYVGDASNYLRISATLCNIGLQSANQSNQGSGRIKLNFGTVATTVNVYNTAANSADSGLDPVRLLGTNAANVLNVFDGSVGVATTGSGEVATFVTITAGTGGPTLTLGKGVTMTTLNVGSGTTTNLGANVTTVNVSGVNTKYICLGTATHGTLNVDSGVAKVNSSGTITTANVTGQLDLTGSPGLTVTNCTAYKGAGIKMDNGKPGSFTFTNGIVLARGCKLMDVSFETANGVTVRIS